MIILCSHGKNTEKCALNIYVQGLAKIPKQVLKKEEKVSCLVGSVSMGYTNLRHV
jgi:hypothetical protein